MKAERCRRQASPKRPEQAARGLGPAGLHREHAAAEVAPRGVPAGADDQGGGEEPTGPSSHQRSPPKGRISKPQPIGDSQVGQAL